MRSPSVGRVPGPAVLATRSLRVTWRRMVLLYVAMVVAMGAGTLVFTRFQRDVFEETTSRFEEEVGALAEVDRRLLAAEVPLGGILYELGRTGDLEDQWRQFQDHGRHIEAGLTRLERMTSGSRSQALVRAEEAWLIVAREVEAAKQLWGTGVAAAALAKGEDPFAKTVWKPLTEAQEALAAALGESARTMRVRTHEAERRQALVQPIVLATMAAALALGLLSGWRLSKRVIRPLSELRRAAARMRDGHLGEPVETGGPASSEVSELAAAMNQMAGALSRTQDRLRDQAYTDALTGMVNRKAFAEFLEEAFPGAADDQLAVLLVDVDDFKFVNDSLGHAAGDAVLRAVAGRLRSAVRDDDMVARLGGDEFAVVVQAHDAPATAAVVAERILSSLQRSVAIGGSDVEIGCSIGIATGAPQSTTADEVVRNADIAMYMAKSRGKNCFEMFDRTMHLSMMSRIERKQDVSKAVERDQLVLHYQPVIDLESGTVLGFEALVRWQHPAHGMVAPTKFIGLAEETGDILAVGGRTIDRACRDLANFQATSGDPRLWMAVNVSAHQVVAGDLIEAVHQSLARHGLDPTSLILEITEQAFIADTERASRILAQLRAEGIKVALDDFGTGFSSLRSLQELPVDVIKIDRSFISGSGADDDGGVILEAIVTMARGLGMDLIAEGIEHHDELHRIRRLGCRVGQGYLIARPLPADEAAEFARSGAFAVAIGVHPASLRR